MEIWKTINGYENYEISSHGGIRKSNGSTHKCYLCGRGYYFVSIKNENGWKSHMMHNLVMQNFRGLPETNGKMIVDHIDGCRINNNINNLRYVTLQLNRHNSKKANNTSSKYHGVIYNKKNQNYMSTITYQKKSIYLGSYISDVEAARAYDAKVKELYGGCGRLNFP